MFNAFSDVNLYVESNEYICPSTFALLELINESSEQILNNTKSYLSIP